MSNEELMARFDNIDALAERLIGACVEGTPQHSRAMQHRDIVRHMRQTVNGFIIRGEQVPHSLQEIMLMQPTEWPTQPVSTSPPK
jgi:regulator of sirC expression with transglutaminase-like and TPR domain